VLPDDTPLDGTVAENIQLMCQSTKAAPEAAGSSLDRVVRVQLSTACHSFPFAVLALNISFILDPLPRRGGL
jgi:hypothetical protein